MQYAGKDIYKCPSRLLQDLIRFNTTNPPGNEAECIKYINNILTQAGFKTSIFAKDHNRPNLISRLKGENTAPPLLLYGHVDVVSTADQTWTYPPFDGILADGFLWGRGTLDMKGGIAMFLSALLRAKAENLIPAGDIVLAVLSDEEEFGNFGAKYMVENHADQFKGIRYAIGEFGAFSFYLLNRKFYPIQVEEKQLCTLRAIIRGPGGHGALPFRGGAMAKIARLLYLLDKHRLPVHITPTTKKMIISAVSSFPCLNEKILNKMFFPCLVDKMLNLLGNNGDLFSPLFHNTVNATIIRGGDKINVIPGKIVVELDGRLLPGFKPDNLIKELYELLGNDVEIETVRYDFVPAVTDMGLYNTLANILHKLDPDGIALPVLLAGVTDGRFFSQLGIQTYGFLPMNLPKGFDFSSTIHAANERIPIDSIEFGSNAIFKLLQQYGR